MNSAPSIDFWAATPFATRLRHWRPGVAARVVSVLAFLCAVPSLFAAALTATLDRATISEGETAQLSIGFQDSSPSGPPAVPAVRNLAMHYRGQSTSYSFVNGRSSSSVTYTYLLVPAAPGDYTIPAISATAGGQRLTSQPLSLKVLQASQRGSGQQPSGAAGQAAFVRLVLPKTNVYLGESFVVEIQLYVQNAENPQMPQVRGDGFTFGQPIQSGVTSTQVGNTLYRVLSLKMAARAVKAGALSLGPIEWKVVLLRTISDDFLFPRSQRTQVTLKSDAYTVNVLPLPATNRPPDFNGAVGSFSLVATGGPTNVSVGDPITMKVQIRGNGALDALPYPPQTSWRDFQLYPPNSKVEAADQLGLSGVKTFEQVIVPQSASVTAIPPLVFSFFDPATKAYRTVQSRPIPLTVKPNMSAQPQPTVAAASATSDDAAQKPRDIVHIKPYLGTLHELQPALLQRPWFLGLQLIPFAIWLASLAWRRRQDRFAADPRLRRRVQVDRSVRKGLAELSQLAQARESENFFATVFRLLQEQLGDKLDMPASAITESAIDDQLRPRGVPDALATSLHELFQQCNQARYAPHRSTQELAALAPKVEAALRELKKVELKSR